MRPSPSVSGPVRFTCTACGACCRTPGRVYAVASELEAMARHLGLRITAFIERYRVVWDPAAHAYAMEATRDAPCPLLGADDRCTVHPVKPSQCRTFPFWPELLDSEAQWAKARRSCEGIDHPDGRVYSRRTLRVLRRAGTTAGP